MSASVIKSQGSYQAMTATIVDAPEVTDDFDTVLTMATDTFQVLQIWMLQHTANAKIAEDIEANVLLFQSIVESAKLL